MSARVERWLLLLALLLYSPCAFAHTPVLGFLAIGGPVVSGIVVAVVTALGFQNLRMPSRESTNRYRALLVIGGCLVALASVGITSEFFRGPGYTAIPFVVNTAIVLLGIVLNVVVLRRLKRSRHENLSE